MKEKFYVTVGVIGVVVLSVCLIFLSYAWAHSVWAQNSVDYATELNAQATILQARAIDTEARRQEYEGIATALGVLAPVILSMGALLTGLGWLVFLVIGGFGLLRSIFAISRVVESRGILPRLQEEERYALLPTSQQQVLAAPGSRVAARLRDRGLTVRAPPVAGGRSSDDQSLFAVPSITRSTATGPDRVDISPGGIVYKSPIRKSSITKPRNRKRG